MVSLHCSTNSYHFYYPDEKPPVINFVSTDNRTSVYDPCKRCTITLYLSDTTTNLRDERNNFTASIYTSAMKIIICLSSDNSLPLACNSS